MSPDFWNWGIQVSKLIPVSWKCQCLWTSWKSCLTEAFLLNQLTIFANSSWLFHQDLDRWSIRTLFCIFSLFGSLTTKSRTKWQKFNLKFLISFRPMADVFVKKKKKHQVPRKMDPWRCGRLARNGPRERFETMFPILLYIIIVIVNNLLLSSWYSTYDWHEKNVWSSTFYWGRFHHFLGKIP